MNSFRFVSFTFIAALIFGNAQAQLATWNISQVSGTNAAATNPLSATTLGAHISSASLTLGSGVTASSSADTFGGSAFNTTTLAAAITGGDFISFTITPTAGYTLSISSISFNSGVATAVTNFNGSLLSSATGFTAGSSLLTYSFATAGAPAQTATLSGVSALQNLSTAVEFRIYGYRDTVGTSTFRIRDLSGNDLTINGSTALAAIPEPSTYAAIFGGVALVGVAIRRQRAKAALSKAA